MAMLPDMSQLENVVVRDEGVVVGSGGTTFESDAAVMGDFAKLAQGNGRR